MKKIIYLWMISETPFLAKSQESLKNPTSIIQSFKKAIEGKPSGTGDNF